MFQGTDDQAAADHAAGLLHAAHPKQVDLVAHTYASRCLAAVTSLEIGGGRELLLVETEDVGGIFLGGRELGIADGACDPGGNHGGRAWFLELVQGTPARAKLLSKVEVGRNRDDGSVRAQMARLAGKPLLIDVHWGLDNESDGACSNRDVWRVRDTKLERLLRFPSCSSGDGPDGYVTSSGFSADADSPLGVGEVQVEAWHKEESRSESGPDFRVQMTGTYVVGEESVRVLRALATPSASSTLPPSKAGDYRPDGNRDDDPARLWQEPSAVPGQRPAPARAYRGGGPASGRVGAAGRVRAPAAGTPDRRVRSESDEGEDDCAERVARGAFQGHVRLRDLRGGAVLTEDRVRRAGR